MWLWIGFACGIFGVLVGVTVMVLVARYGTVNLREIKKQKNQP